MSVKAWIDEQGIHVPNYPDILEDLKKEFKNIYGEDVYLEADSQDGALCAVFALRLYDCYTMAASVYNAYSPTTAQGVGLSSVVKTNGIRRSASSHSQVVLRIIGQAGTLINRGIVSDESGQRWLLPDEVIIPLSGELSVTAIAEETGEIRAVAGEISNIATPIRGWQAVTNPLAVTLGSAVETDATLRNRQKASTAIPSLSILDGAKGTVASLPGVLRSRCYENDNSVVDNNGIPAHSVSFVVEGGDTQEIAKVIALKKGPGCGTYGDISVDIRDKFDCPSIIRFFRPEVDNIRVRIQIRPLTGYVSTTGLQIQQNIVAYINCLPIGEPILHSKLYSPINEAEPDQAQRTFDILSIQIGRKDEDLLAQNRETLFNHVTSCSLDDVTIIGGQ